MDEGVGEAVDPIEQQMEQNLLIGSKSIELGDNNEKKSSEENTEALQPRNERADTRLRATLMKLQVQIYKPSDMLGMRPYMASHGRPRGGRKCRKRTFEVVNWETCSQRPHKRENDQVGIWHWTGDRKQIRDVCRCTNGAVFLQ
ncbi:unnamed protein product, partial [Mesorhabditis spiculigera]